VLLLPFFTGLTRRLARDRSDRKLHSSAVRASPVRPARLPDAMLRRAIVLGLLCVLIVAPPAILASSPSTFAASTSTVRHL
jgi:hypothetical protein